MKKILLILTFLALLSCQEEVRKDYVYDNENILSAEQEDKLSSLFIKHQEKTSNDIGLVTTPDWQEKTDPLSFATYFVEKNNCGNDVLIVFSLANFATLISTSPEMKSILTNEKGKEIVEDVMFPLFVEEKFYEGLYEGSEAIIRYLEEEIN